MSLYGLIKVVVGDIDPLVDLTSPPPPLQTTSDFFCLSQKVQGDGYFHRLERGVLNFYASGKADDIWVGKC